MGKKSETTKTPKVKVPYTHACVFYGGIIKTGYCVVEVTHEAPEVLYANLKKYYGEEEKGFRGKYTRCTKSIDTVRSEIEDKLEDKKISDMTFNYNSSEVVKIMKEVCEASKCKTMGVYTNEDGDSSNKKAEADDSEDEKPKKKSVTKKTAKSDDEEEEKPKKKTASKKAAKDESESEEDEKPKKSTKAKETKETKDSKKKVTKVEESDEEEEPKKASKSKSKEVKDTKESKSKTKKAKIESDDEEDAPVTKRSSNKTIIISDDESSEEEN